LGKKCARIYAKSGQLDEGIKKLKYHLKGLNDLNIFHMIIELYLAGGRYRECY